MTVGSVAIGLGFALLLAAGLRRFLLERASLLERVAQLEERTAALAAEGRTASENVAVLQRLLLEKGVVDEEDFEAARRSDELDAIAHPRDVH